MTVYNATQSAYQEYQGNTQIAPASTVLFRSSTNGAAAYMAGFTFNLVIPQAVTVGLCRLKIRQNNQLIAGTGYGENLYLAVENCLDGRALNDPVNGDTLDPLVKRLTAHSDAVAQYGSRTGITHSGNMSSDPAVGPLDGSPGIVCHAWDNQVGPAVGADVTFLDMSSALQPLVDDPAWNPNGQKVNVFLFWSQANNPGGAGDWDLYPINSSVVWDNGQAGSNQAHVTQGGQINYSITPTLDVEYSTSNMLIDGVGTSSGSAKLRDTKLLAKWYGLDSGNTTSPIYGAILPMITAGRGDLPPTRNDSANPLSVTVGAAGGYYNLSPTTKTRFNGPGKGAFQRRAIEGYDHLLPVGVYPSSKPYVYWDFRHWSRLPGAISTYSGRWLSQVNTVGTANESAVGTVVAGLKDDEKVWAVEYNNNLGVTNESRELRLRTWDRTDPQNVVVWTSPWTDYANQEKLGAGWNRIEVQVSEEDTEYNFRLRAFVYFEQWETTHFDDVATFRMDLNVPEPSTLKIDTVRYGSSALDTGGNSLHNWALADMEWWSDYDLNGTFQNPIVDPDRGFPLVTSDLDTRPFEMEFYHYDGTDITSMDYVGTVLKPNSGPDPLILDGQYIPDDRLDWDENLSGADGAAVSAGSSNAYNAKQGTVVYDTDITPVGESHSLIHTTASGTAESYVTVNMPANTRSLYFRTMVYVDPFPNAQGSANNSSKIISFDDSSGNPIASVSMNWVGELTLYDGEINTAQGLVTLEAGAWSLLEFYINQDADPTNANSAYQLLFRCGHEERGFAFWPEWEKLGTYNGINLDVNDNDIDRVRVGLMRRSDANVGGTLQNGMNCSIRTSAVAYDQDTWCGPPVDNPLEPVPIRPVKDSYMGTLSFKGTPVAGLEGGGVDYTLTSSVPYHMGASAGSIRTCDVYVPTGDVPEGGWPVVEWMHGGSWTDGNKLDIAKNVRDTILANGWALVSPRYQLGGDFGAWDYSSSDDGRWPTYVCDFKQCGAWIRDQGSSAYNLNPSKIVSSGYSAGSFNALAAVLTEGIDDDFATPYDLTLAGNPSYLYSNVLDPHYIGYYGFAIPASPYKLKAWQEGPAPSFDSDVQGGRQIGYYATRNLMGNQANWEADLEWLQPYWWVYVQNIYAIGLNQANPLDGVVLGGTLGDADYFVFSDPKNTWPEYSMVEALRLATIYSSSAPDSFNMDWFTYNGLNHDYVEQAFDATHLSNFLSQFTS